MIIDGKAIAAQVKASLQGSDAKLAVIMVGDDPASSVYVRNKDRAATRADIAARRIRGFHLPAMLRNACCAGQSVSSGVVNFA